MNNKFSQNKTNEGFLAGILFGVCSAFVVMFILVVLFALIMSLFKISTEYTGIISMVIIIISGLICGIVTSKKSNKNSLVLGITSGACTYLIIAVISAAITKESFSSMFIIRLVVVTICSAVGAIIKNFRKTKNYV